MKFISITCVVLEIVTQKASAGFVSPRVRPSSDLRHSSRQKRDPCASAFYYKSRRSDPEQDDDSPVLVQAVDTIVSLASGPTPGVPSLALGFPMALLLVTWTQSWPTALVTTILFSLLAWFGRSVVLDEDDSPDSSPSSSFLLLDGITFLVALIASNVFVPSLGSSVDSGVIAGVSLAILAVVQVLRDPIPKDSPQERLMDQWDDRFRGSKVNGQKKKKPKDSTKDKKK